ncbi:MAG: cardiolipin synthase [Desulfosarcinaceae bacterium]|nr:cardiolipin synthase [Desulfosarcinaceae bacterium]
MALIGYVMDNWLFLAALVMHAISWALVYDAIMHGRTSQGTIAWVMGLLFFPYLFVIFYLAFGARRIGAYAIHRQSGRSPVVRLGHRLHRDPALMRRMVPAVPLSGVLNPLTQLPALTGNRTTLLVDGEQTFASLLEGIAQAQEYVLVQFFRVHDDALGDRLRQALIDKARTGVKVYFLYDKIGSVGLSRIYLAGMRAAGIRVGTFRVGRGWLNRFRVNFRNHRKIVVVDGHTCWVGGHNVGSIYLDGGRRFDHWRDTHVKIYGPVTLAVQLTVAEDWLWACGDLPKLSWSPPPPDGSETILCLPTGPGDLMETASLMMVEAIHRAQRRCWIMTPYFVPDVAVIKALQLAAMRGVDVRILIPGKPDKRVVWWAAHSYLFEVAVAGVRLYTYQPGFMHQKVFLIDDELAGIGTVNLDNRSLRINFEITMVFLDRGFIAQIEEMCANDFAQADLLTPDEVYRRPLYFRLAIRAARLFSPIL